MNLFYLNPIKPFEDKELIKYMNKRILEEKGVTFSDIRDLLRKKYNKCEWLQNEKDSLNLRKVALENAAMENITAAFFTAMAVLVAILAIVELNLIFKSLMVIYCILSIIAFLKFYEYKVITRAKEIAYCDLAIEVINEV